jgi:hypothetical protein
MFNVNELKKRIEYFEGEKTLPEGEFAGQGAIMLNPSDLQDASFVSGKGGMSTYDQEKVRSQLSRIKELCNWAIQHGFTEVYAT